MKTRRIAIVYGGYSGERVISERSAAVVMKYLDTDRYESILVDVCREGWFAVIEENRIKLDLTDFSYAVGGERKTFDGVFNAIHGTPGEDGRIQGYFDVIGMPYNNCGVLASSLTFNKVACNRYLNASGIHVAESFLARVGDPVDEEVIIERVGLPCFVKPNDGGSSIGVTKVKKREQLTQAIAHAQEEGVDALIESFLDGVEVSCGCIMKNGKPESLAVTEIVATNEFFDFDAKYFNKGTEEITPARIDAPMYDRVMALTEDIYHFLHCKGMMRADYMIVKDKIVLIEVNTTPGMSEASIIPQQAVHHGMTLNEFFTQSIDELF